MNRENKYNYYIQNKYKSVLEAKQLEAKQLEAKQLESKYREENLKYLKVLTNNINIIFDNNINFTISDKIIINSLRKKNIKIDIKINVIILFYLFFT